MHLFSTPYPLPDAVLRNTFQTLPHFLPRGSRIVLYPANQVAETLICQEALSLWHVLGTVANGKKSHPFIKPTFSLEELKGIKADAMLAVDPCFPDEPS